MLREYLSHVKLLRIWKCETELMKRECNAQRKRMLDCGKYMRILV